MFKEDARESVPIVQQTIAVLLAAGPRRGRIGADLRTAIGEVQAFTEALLVNDRIGPYLVHIFEHAFDARLTRKQIADARRTARTMSPRTAGAMVVRNALIELSLATEARIIADMRFISRSDVDRLKDEMNEAFRDIEEEVADSLDSLTYRALIKLHAAVMNYLVDAGRPLPRILRYQFAKIMPSLIMAHRLYGDASRADELRYENKVIHPAFMLLTGRALSF
jgi:hypothetical protein